MKKRLCRLAFALLALLTLLSLLVTAPVVKADALPTYEGTCSKCGQITFNLVGYEPNYTPGTHSPLYKCPNCDYWARVGGRFEYCSGGTATCTQRKRCSICGGEYGELASHEMEPHGMKEPTCTEGGWDAYTACKNCGYSADKESIPPLSHSFEAHAEAKYLASVATCVSKARYYLHCAYCRQMSSSTFEAGDVDLSKHDLVSHDAKAPTCTEIGWNAYETCTRCDYTTYAELPADKDNHDLVHHEAKAATCTEKGWNAYETCSRCDYTTYAELSALTHDLADHAAKAPTCTEIGWAAYETCQREGCDYTTYTELSVDLDNHDLEHHDGKAPTCTEKGWSAYDTCTRCDYTTYVELPIDPDNHALIHVKAQAPTCTDSGWDAYDICQRCGYTTFKELPALGHWYGEWTPNGDGTQTAACKRGCGHKAKVNCAEQKYALPMGENEEAYEFTLCPVCGRVSDGTKLALVEKVTAKAVTRWLPAGEPVLRLGTLENGELVLIAGFEYAGQLTQPTGKIQFTLPAEHLEGFTLTVINADGTEEPLDYTIEKDQATFTLDFTDTQTPTILIHLTPEV